MNFQEYLDDHLSKGAIKAFSSDGNILVSLAKDDDENLHAASTYYLWEVFREVPTANQFVVYLRPTITAIQRPDKQDTPYYQGTFSSPEEEAEWSYNWRKRAFKASPKQLAVIHRYIDDYQRLKKEKGWPDEPEDLLNYEASDVLTELFALHPKKGGKSK